MKKPGIILLFIVINLSLIQSCSKEVSTYDELSQRGEVESLVRKKYKGFFKAVARLEQLSETSNDARTDSTIISKAAAAADGVMENFILFPKTVDSRLAFDAFACAAHDLNDSPFFSTDAVSFFWENALLNPMFTKGQSYIQSQKYNESTHYQVIAGLQKGMGTKATGGMLMQMITLIGPTPSEKVMEICRADSLVLKKIHDLLIYTRSLQQFGPPLWMTTGLWFMALEIEGRPLSFFSLKPVIVDKGLYLVFRDYNHGAVYAEFFGDPVPDDPDKTDAWLARAGAVMSSLNIDDALAEMIKAHSLPVYDAYNFYNDFMLCTEADSVKKEFTLILKRQKTFGGMSDFAGADSISVLFTTKQIEKSEGLVTRLAASRVQGASMSGSRIAIDSP